MLRGFFLGTVKRFRCNVCMSSTKYQYNKSFAFFSQTTTLQVRLPHAPDGPGAFQVTHQIARQEVGRPLALDLVEHVVGGNLDVLRVDAWESGDFLGFFSEDRFEERGRDGLARVLMVSQAVRDSGGYGSGELTREGMWSRVSLGKYANIPSWRSTCTTATAAHGRSPPSRRLP